MAPCGAMSLDPTTVLYNTEGWIRVGNDNPRHTHVFMMTSAGCAKVVRVPFRHSQRLLARLQCWAELDYRSPVRYDAGMASDGPRDSGAAEDPLGDAAVELHRRLSTAHRRLTRLTLALAVTAGLATVIAIVATPGFSPGGFILAWVTAAMVIALGLVAAIPRPYLTLRRTAPPLTPAPAVRRPSRKHGRRP